MKIYRIDDPVEAAKKSDELLAGEEGLIVCVNSQHCVLNGVLKTLDPAACERLNIPVAQGRYLGGSIVCMPGDLSLCMVTWGLTDWGQRVFDTAVNWLRGKGLDVVLDKNDALVDGKKILSWGRLPTIKGWVESVVHFSVGQMDLGLVLAICTKPMQKVPGALSEYGITAAMILDKLSGDGLLTYF